MVLTDGIVAEFDVRCSVFDVRAHGPMGRRRSILPAGGTTRRRGGVFYGEGGAWLPRPATPPALICRPSVATHRTSGPMEGSGKVVIASLGQDNSTGGKPSDQPPIRGLRRHAALQFQPTSRGIDRP